MYYILLRMPAYLTDWHMDTTNAQSCHSRRLFLTGGARGWFDPDRQRDKTRRDKTDDPTGSKCCHAPKKTLPLVIFRVCISFLVHAIDRYIRHPLYAW